MKPKRRPHFPSFAATRLSLLPATLLLTGLAVESRADVIAQWLPVAGDATVSQYHNANQTPPPTVTGAGVTVSNADRVNQPGDANAGAVWPGSVANRGGTAAVYDPQTSGYTEFTITPLPGSAVTYTSLTYSLNSYGGMSDAAGYTAVVRTSVDDFATELATNTIVNATSGTFTVSLAGLGTSSGAITFRLYIVDNAGPNTWADLTTANGGMVVNGTATARHETITWTAGATDIWDIGGADDNWTSSDGAFQQGDNVVFGDTVNELFSGIVTITGTPLVGTFTADNSAIDYSLAGNFAGTGAFTKNGTGQLTLRAPAAESIAFSGPITINAGTLELANNTNALSNVPLVTVNPDGVFRFAANNAGQDSNVPFLLAGGTLDVDDSVYTWPDNKTVTLAAGTTSTFDISGAFIAFNNRITGSGNLVKTGAGTLEATATYNNILDLLTYTGSTEIREGTVLIGASNTAASTVWNVNGGMLRLNSDSAAPIANLPATAAVSVSTGGTIDLRGNTETLQSLAAAGGTLTVNPDTHLTVGTLNLSGGELEIATEGFSGNGPFTIMNVGTVTGPLANLKTAGRGGVFSVQGGAILLTLAPAAITWTAGTTDTWEINGADANWSSPDGTFQQGDSVIFDDTVDSLFSGLITIIDTPRVDSFTANNSTVTYTLSGSFAGTGALTKNGTGLFTLLAPGTALPFSGPVNVNAGILELGGNTNALSNVPMVTVNPGGTFRYAAGNAGQDSNVPFTLAGGTLQVNDTVFTWPGEKPVTLATGTTSTIETGATLYVYNNVISGSGNLIKTGAGTLDAASNYNAFVNLLTYTGSTEVREGVFRIGAANTAASPAWSITGGSLRLDPDNAAPMANLSPLAAVTMSAGTFELRANTETIASLTVTGGTLILDTSSVLTISGTLDLTGGPLAVDVEGYKPGLNPVLSVGAITGPLANLTTTIPGATFSFENGVLTLTVPGGSPATGITVDSIVTGPGSTAGTTQVTLNFTADGAVDIYASEDLNTWGAPIATGVTASPFIDENLAAAKRFYVLVPAGTVYPPAP